MNWQLLSKLSDTPGVSGHEEKVAEIFREKVKKYTKEITTDAMGNVIAHIPGEGPRIALDAHSDEVGFIVCYIEDNGFLRVQPLGGIDPRVFYAQRVKVWGKKPMVGVVGAIPPHLTRGKGTGKDSAVPIDEVFIDTGEESSEVKRNVAIGDIVTFDSECYDSGNSLIGKAFDDRVGLFMMLEAIGVAKNIKCDLYLVAAVQEERGLRGTTCAAFGVEPEIAIALEGTVANDLPGVPGYKRLAQQGLGPELRITDGRMIADRSLVSYLSNLAETNKIPHQFTVKSVGTTNATAIQTSRKGVRVAAISIPVRYIHGPQGLVRKSDVEYGVSLVKAFLENADRITPRSI